MTVMCDRFFGIPQTVVRHGKFKALSPVAVKLLIALWYESERCRTRELTRTTKALSDLVGGSPNSHNKARAELEKAGLVLVTPCGEKEKGFIFHLCNPETGKPWPIRPNERVIYQKKNAPPPTTDQELPDPILPETPSLLPETSPPSKTLPLSEDPALSRTPAHSDTEFDFGFNCAAQNAAPPTNGDAPIPRSLADYSPFDRNENEPVGW